MIQMLMLLSSTTEDDQSEQTARKLKTINKLKKKTNTMCFWVAVFLHFGPEQSYKVAKTPNNMKVRKTT